MVNSQAGRAEGHISIRLPADIFRQLKDLADAKDRTLSVEIIERLRLSLTTHEIAPIHQPSIAEIAKRLEPVEQAILNMMFTFLPHLEERLNKLEAQIKSD